MLIVLSMYAHDAKLEYVSQASLKPSVSVKPVAEDAMLEDIALLSVGRHTHIPSTSLPTSVADYSTSLASAQPRNKENEDKYAAQNKLVCNTYGTSSK